MTYFLNIKNIIRQIPHWDLHLWAFIAYVSLSLGLGFALPRLFPQIASSGAIIGIMMLLFLLLHLFQILIIREQASRVVIRRLKKSVKEDKPPMPAVSVLPDEPLKSSPNRQPLDDGEQIKGMSDDKQIDDIAVLEEIARNLGRGDRSIERNDSDMSKPYSLAENEAMSIVQIGLRDNQLRLYLQSIVGLKLRQNIGYEILCRIKDAKKGIVQPRDFINAAIDSRLIRSIDNIMLIEWVNSLKKYPELQNSKSFFNLHPVSLLNKSFANDLIRYLENNRQVVRGLIIEFPQAALIEHYQLIEEECNRLVELGFNFSLDHVADINFDYDIWYQRGVSYIKVPVTFFQVGKGQLVDEMVINWRRDIENTGITLIAEKVERGNELEQLKRYNINYAQGILFSNPRKASTILENAEK